MVWRNPDGEEEAKLRHRFLAQVVRTLWGESASYEVLMDGDEAVARALHALTEESNFTQANGAVSLNSTTLNPTKTTSLMAFELPQLPYAYDALEPHIDARTMEIHHSKHHAGYTSKLNAAVKARSSKERTLKPCSGTTATTALCATTAVVFGTTTCSGPACPPTAAVSSGALGEAIDRDFGSFDAFKDAFAKAAATLRLRVGLALRNDGKLEVCSSANQDNP